jgi:hypothetical protein
MLQSNHLMIDDTFMIMVSPKIKKVQNVHVGMVCVMKIVGDTNRLRCGGLTYDACMSSSGAHL